MKTEQELYNGLRSALKAHEALPFSQIRAAVAEAKGNAAAAESVSKPKPFLLRQVRQLAFAAACLVLLAGAGLFFLSDTLPWQHETALLEEAGSLSGEVPLDGAANVAEAPMAEGALEAESSTAGDNIMAYSATQAPPEATEDAPGNLSEELKELLQQYADQPDYQFAVLVFPPDEKTADATRQYDSGESAQTQYLTAEEIYGLASKNYSLDIATSTSSAS